MRQPWDPDPLHVEPEPVTVEPRCPGRGCTGHHVDGSLRHERRVGITIPLTVGIAIVITAVVLIVSAASRSASLPSHPVVAQSGTPHGAAAVPAERPSVPGEDTPTTIGTRPASSGAAAGLVPPAATPRWHGTATWYCSATSDCPRGYGPSDLVAAIDRKDSPFRKGDRVVVRYHCGQGCEHHVTVTVVDVCGCGGVRLIDLTSGAFRRLAPLGQGVIPVTIEAAGASVTPPQTETKP